MAQEMGRQEQKLGRLMNNGPEGEGAGSDLLELIDLIGDLLDLLGLFDGAGSYEINSPCHKDPATGELLPPLAASWGVSVGLGSQITKRLDAIAQLLQHHKDLPQPICSRPRPTGEPVTVQFEEV
jgi:hypothetical protein